MPQLIRERSLADLAQIEREKINQYVADFQECPSQEALAAAYNQMLMYQRRWIEQKAEDDVPSDPHT